MGTVSGGGRKSNEWLQYTIKRRKGGKGGGSNKFSRHMSTRANERTAHHSTSE